MPRRYYIMSTVIGCIVRPLRRWSFCGICAIYLDKRHSSEPTSEATERFEAERERVIKKRQEYNRRQEAGGRRSRIVPQLEQGIKHKHQQNP